MNGSMATLEIFREHGAFELVFAYRFSIIYIYERHTSDPLAYHFEKLLPSLPLFPRSTVKLLSYILLQ